MLRLGDRLMFMVKTKALAFPPPRGNTGEVSVDSPTKGGWT
jgi:hypothetical protein